VNLPPNVQTLMLADYSRDPGNNKYLFARFNVYDHNGGSETVEALAAVYNFAGNDAVVTHQVPPSGANCAGLTNCIVRITALNAIPSSPNNVLIQTQPGHIMDWTPKWTLQSLGSWTYESGHLDQIKVKF